MADLTEGERPERGFLDRFKSDPDRRKRQERYSKLAKLVREALEARHDCLDDADIAAFVGRMKLSQQDIDGMLAFLARDTARVRDLNGETETYLRALTPERIWTGDPPPPIPKAGFTVEVLHDDGTVEVIEGPQR